MTLKVMSAAIPNLAKSIIVKMYQLAALVTWLSAYRTTW